MSNSFNTNSQKPQGSFDKPNDRVDRISQLGAQLNANENNLSLNSNIQPQASNTSLQNIGLQQQQQQQFGQSSGSGIRDGAPIPIHPQTNIGGMSSESHLSHLKEQFVNSANTLTAFYKQSCNSFDLAYSQGKQDAYEDVFMWFMSQGDNGSFKHVSVNQFNQFMQDRMQSNGSAINNVKPQDQFQDSKFMPPPPNRQPHYKQNNAFASSESSNEPSSQELIRMCANQGLKESYQEGAQINKKVSSNMFQSIKFAENKKRVRQSSSSNNEGVQSIQSNEIQQISEQQNQQNIQSDGDFVMSEQPSSENRDFKQIKRRNMISNQSHSPPEHQLNSNQNSQPPQLSNMNADVFGPK